LNLPDEFRFSKWVHLYENNGTIAVFHALNIDVVFITASVSELISLLRAGTTIDHIRLQRPSIAEDILPILKDLFDRGFITGVHSDDEVVFQKKREEAILPPGLETLYLLLTDSCNLRCSYCFILNGMPKQYHYKSMTFEIAKRAVDTYFTNLNKNSKYYDHSRKIITFYGGEPLVNFQVAKMVVDYVESNYANELDKLGGKFIFSLITNGTLIDKKVATYIATHPRIAITVSLDGDALINDQKRVYQNGKGTFQDVMRGLRCLRDAGCKNISISCTVDEHNIDNLEKLLDFQEEFGFLSINMNPLLDTERDRVGMEYIEKMSSRLISYFQKAREHGVYEDRIMRKVRPFLSHKIHTHDCQATGHQIVCSPDGKLGVCQEGIGMKNYFFSDVSRDFDFHSHPVINEWNARTPLNMPQCKDCPAIGICGGGCTYGAQLRNGSIWSVDDRFCIHSLKTLEWLIWDVYEQSTRSV